MADADHEVVANLIVFVVRDWAEVLDVPNLDRPIDGLGPLVGRLQAAEANQYRVFRFDEAGAIRAAFVFLRMDDELMAVPAQALALGQVVRMLLLWSDTAFRDRSPLAAAPDGPVVLGPEIAGLIRAATSRCCRRCRPTRRCR